MRKNNWTGKDTSLLHHYMSQSLINNSWIIACNWFGEVGKQKIRGMEEGRSAIKSLRKNRKYLLKIKLSVSFCKTVFWEYWNWACNRYWLEFHDFACISIYFHLSAEYLHPAFLNIRLLIVIITVTFLLHLRILSRFHCKLRDVM